MTPGIVQYAQKQWKNRRNIFHKEDLTRIALFWYNKKAVHTHVLECAGALQIDKVVHSLRTAEEAKPIF